MKHSSDVSVLWNGRATLGEGPLWDTRTERLYWVDIAKGEVHAYGARAGDFTEWSLGAQVGCLGLTEDPATVIAGLRTGWQLFDTLTGRLAFIADPEAQRPACRFNDGSVDPAGRFWTGSLEDSETRPEGRLYRLEADGTYATVDEGFYCANGVDWSPDGRWMYFVDSRANRIYRYRFEVSTGAVLDREVFADTTDLPGIPDGLRVDAEGCVWCAFWDGAHLTRFTPDGQVAESVEVPVLRPTSLAFGGPDLRTMYITSASVDLTGEQLAQWPLSGAVLQRAAAVPGRPSHHYRHRPGKA
ncbi:MAG TPA: SMP-30/gluconolactonase/LRE family protein [Actinocrinis sp.]